MTEIFAHALDLYKGNRIKLARDMELIADLPDGRLIIHHGLMLWGFPIKTKGIVPDQIKIEHHDNPDTWAVWLATGQLTSSAVLDCIPYHLPWVVFARDNRLKCYNLQSLLKKLPA